MEYKINLVSQYSNILKVNILTGVWDVSVNVNFKSKKWYNFVNMQYKVRNVCIYPLFKFYLIINKKCQTTHMPPFLTLDLHF